MEQRTVFALTLLLASTCMLRTYAADTTTGSSTDISDWSETESFVSDKDIAETNFYRAQTAKLQSEDAGWHAVLTIVTPGVALLAVVVSFISFYFNLRAIAKTQLKTMELARDVQNDARQQQRDTQFFEALKRFGDVTSPSTRASAAGLIAQLAISEQGRAHYYFQASLDQLSSGLLIESNEIVLRAMVDAMGTLSRLDAQAVLSRHYEANLKLQVDLAHAINWFLITQGSSSARVERAAEPMALASIHTRYKQSTLITLFQRYGEPPPVFFLDLRRRYEACTSLEQREEQEKAVVGLKTVGLQLHANALGVVSALRQFSPADFRDGTAFERSSHDHQRLEFRSSPISLPQRLDNIFLAEADLSFLNLRDASLSGAHLECCKLTLADLRNAVLYNAQLNGAGLDFAKIAGAKLKGASVKGRTFWWRMNFGTTDNNEDSTIDEELLHDLYRRFGNFVPPSLEGPLGLTRGPVRAYIEQMRTPAG